MESYQETLVKLRAEAAALKHGEVRAPVLLITRLTPRQDAEKRVREEIAELDANLDQCQEVKRGTLNKIRGQREASAKLDLEIQAVGERLLQRISKLFPLNVEKFRGENSAIEPGNRVTERRRATAKPLTRGGGPYVS